MNTKTARSGIPTPRPTPRAILEELVKPLFELLLLLSDDNVVEEDVDCEAGTGRGVGGVVVVFIVLLLLFGIVVEEGGLEEDGGELGEDGFVDVDEGILLVLLGLAVVLGVGVGVVVLT